MNVPQIHNLHSQSFNSEFVEFVWKFKEFETCQIIFKANKDKTLYLESGRINEDGNYIDESKVLRYTGWNLDILMTEFPHNIVGHIFNNCEDLMSLHEEVIEFLK